MLQQNGRSRGEALTLRPGVPAACYRRAVADHRNRDYDSVWADVKACRKLGGKFDPKFLAKLRKASAREE